jgi:hypothetical protein
LSAFLVGGIAGCTHQPDDDAVRAEVQNLTLQRGEAALKLADRLTRHGRRALPSIESALHGTDEPGRKNLILALRRIGDADSVPLLLHIAAYDEAEDVRREALWTLKTWAGGSDARAEQARSAVRRVEEIRSTEQAG